ncbi:MAG: complex I NDUFA9 subunit family protein [Parvibaculaceae bacterium]
MIDPTQTLVTIFGGSGFIGRYIVQCLARRGYRIRVGVRRPDLAGHLQPLGKVGQVMPVQANVRYPDSVAAAVSGAHAVINLVGVLSGSGAQSFDAVHVFGAEAVAEAARVAGAKRLIHFSAIGADPQSSSEYGRSKAEGETRTFSAFPDSSVVRPSIVFGPEDDFFNRFAAMARFLPALPLIGGGHTLFQPVYAVDVAEAVARLLETPSSEAKTYELGGPDVRSFKEIIAFTLATAGRKRLLVPVPWSVARIQGAVLGLLPKPLLTLDQVEMLRKDNVVSPEAKADRRTLEGLGIQPQSIDAIVPAYLYRYRKAGQFTTVNG